MLGRRVLLINPPPMNGIAFTRQGRCQEREEVLGTTKPPYSLALMASLLKARGYDIRLDRSDGGAVDDRGADRPVGGQRVCA